MFLEPGTLTMSFHLTEAYLSNKFNLNFFFLNYTHYKIYSSLLFFLSPSYWKLNVFKKRDMYEEFSHLSDMA